jgi:hypothetical protein
METRIKYPTMFRRLKKLGFASYRDYLLSAHWAKLKREYREGDLPQHCLACRDSNYELHHRSYERLGAEIRGDLIPLCRKCHEKVHRYADLHHLRIQATHKIMRKVFGWTKSQTWKRFAPFCSAKKKGYRWLPKTEKKHRSKVARERKWISGPLGLAADGPRDDLIAIARRCFGGDKMP